jgi:hypothetical protein
LFTSKLSFFINNYLNGELVKVDFEWCNFLELKFKFPFFSKVPVNTLNTYMPVGSPEKVRLRRAD